MWEQYMTVAEAARALGLTVRGLHNRIERGGVRVERVHSKLFLIPVAEVERLKGLGKLRPGPKPGSRRKRPAD